MKKIALVLLAGIVVLTILVVPGFAQRPDNVGARSRPDVEQVRQHASMRAQQARVSAEERKAEIMARVEQRKQEVKEDVCQRRQETLTKVMPRLSQGATSVQDSMNTVYNRVVGFYEDGQLTVENYNELVTNVETAKADAEAAVVTIDEFKFELDCDNPSVGKQLDGFRSAVVDARTELKTYRKALVELISSLRAEAASSSDDTDTTSEQAGGNSEQKENDNE